MRYATVLRLRCAGTACLLALGVPTVVAQGSLMAPTGVRFVENRGQWDPRARFLAQAGGACTWLTDRGFVVQVEERDGDGARGVAVHLSFDGASSAPRPGEPDRLQGVRNYLRGSDPSRWVTGVRAFRRVRYESVRPGIDLVVREQSGMVEYDVEVAPHADLARFVMRCEGHDGLHVAPDGTLVMRTALGELRQKPPLTWMRDAHGNRAEIRCRYELLDPSRFRFVVDGWSPEQALTIDPGLVWSSYLGGAGGDSVEEVARTSTGEVIVAGNTDNNPGLFPTTSGAFRTSAFAREVFVTKLLADGSGIVFSTFLGGNNQEFVADLFVASDDTVWVAGRTASSDFPTTADAFVRQKPSGVFEQAFVSQLDATGAALPYSTLFGGLSNDTASALHVDEARGWIYLVGQTSSIPTTANAVGTANAGIADAYVAILDRQSQPGATVLHYGSFLGGSQADDAIAMHVDASGVITIAGETPSSDFPTTAGAFMTSKPPSGTSIFDLFVARIDPAQSGANGLLYASYLGGSAGDTAAGVGMHGRQVVVAGSTSSSDWPVSANALQSVLGRNGDGFVTILDPAASGAAGLSYSTYLGGTGGFDSLFDFDLSGGIVTVAGEAQARNMPTTPGAFQEVTTGNRGYLAQFDLNVAGTPSLRYATLFGLTGQTKVFAVHRDASGHLTFGGQTNGTVPITPGAFQPLVAGSGEGFVAELDPTPLPSGSSKFGIACAGSAGVPDLSPPVALHLGQAFQFDVTGLPASGMGTLHLGASRTQWASFPLPLPLAPFGAPNCTVLASGEVARPVAVSGGRASFSSTTPIDPGLIGSVLFAQFVLIDPPANPLGVVLTNGTTTVVRF